MSLPPQEGGMSFPIIWGKTQARSVSAAEPPAMQFPSDDEIMAPLLCNNLVDVGIIFSTNSPPWGVGGACSFVWGTWEKKKGFLRKHSCKCSKKQTCSTRREAAPKYG